MNRIGCYLILLIFISCNNERIVQLPEIEGAKITEVRDVSPAYIFYDETQPDSTLLNRKNLIISTNWLFNVDKRLTLRQAIPHIKFLQDKKLNAKMHKNEEAKNYFTCNDTSINNLGFIEFTDVKYITDETSKNGNNDYCTIMVNNMSDITFSSSIDLNIKFSKENLKSALETVKKEFNKSFTLSLSFNDSISFQDYITFKHALNQLDYNISEEEFIF